MLKKFIKTHNAGNDFLLFDLTNVKEEIKFDIEWIKKICHRNFGGGGDGILLVLKEDDKYRMRIYNNDGSLAAMCGNGLSCVARFLVEKKYVEEGSFDILTESGIRTPHVVTNEDGKLDVCIKMGIPELEKEKIPVILDNKKDKIINEKIKVLDRDFFITTVSVGNPHCVIFVEEKIDLTKYGAYLETHPMFPDRINVEFVQIINENEIRIDVWERGAGPTLACGTGTCAVAVAGVLNKKFGKNDVLAHLPGGDLTVKYDEDGYVYLRCNPEFVYEAEICDEF